jgi:polyisoprenoid-binding protein YceI
MTMIWEIDSTHSRVSFAIRVMSVTTTRGSFNTLRGQLHIDEQNPASSWVAAEIDAASINTHNRLRDTHLRSNAFFAVKKYPTISFRSTRVEHTGGNAYKVTGNLTLLGTTKPITFDVEYSGQSAGFNARASLTARATMNRHDFGLGQSMKLQAAAGKTATVEIALIAIQKAGKESETKVSIALLSQNKSL